MLHKQQSLICLLASLVANRHNKGLHFLEQLSPNVMLKMDRKN